MTTTLGEHTSTAACLPVAVTCRDRGSASDPRGFVVLRSSGHSGSRWLSELLSTQNLTFLSESAGHCSARYTESANKPLAARHK